MNFKSKSPLVKRTQAFFNREQLIIKALNASAMKINAS